MIGNTRIAIRDSTDSFNIGFFDNQSGIKYNSADLNRFLAGSATILTLRYYSKDIDTIRTGCKLSFEYKGEKYWLNILEVKKTGFNVELTAFSTVLEANNEIIGPYKAQSGENIVRYINRFDPEHAFAIGINEVADKSIKLEWTGKDTVLARLYSVANYFDAELEFVTELNNDYSLKRHVLNIYKKGNLGRVINSPVRAGKDLKTIDYEDSIKELRTEVYCKGKDGITIAGLNKKVYDDKGRLLYFTDGPYLRAPQAKDRYPSIGKNSPDGYILLTLDDTEHETKEALYGYMLGRIKDVSNPKLTFTAEGGFDTKIGDTRILIDDVHFEPELYVQARVIETEESMLTGKANRTVFSNYERKYNQLSDDLLKRVEELAKEAMPYTLELATNNGTAFKNGLGSSLITPTLKRGTEVISGASFAWYVNGALSKTGDTFEVLASTVEGTTVIKVEAIISGQVVASTEVTFTNVDDGKEGATVQSISTMNKLSDTAVVSKTGSFSTNMPNPTKEAPYVVSYLKTTLTDGTVVESDAFISETWNDSYVGKSEISVTQEGIVTSASKTVNGQTIASMIAQRAEWVEIITRLLKIKADMIVDGAITADKLNVAVLSALTSNLGTVTAGNLLLQRSFKAGSSVIPAYKYPDYKTGLFVDNHGLLVNGMPVQKTFSETMASDMPIVAVTAGEVRFSRVDITENLERLLHEGLSDPDFGSIQFGRDPDGRNALAIQAKGQIYLKAENYTDWSMSTVNNNVRWKVQGNLVIVDYDVTFPTSGTKHIVTVSTKYVHKALMLDASAWYGNNTKDKKAQLNADGGLHILGAEANQRYCGQIVWAY